MAGLGRRERMLRVLGALVSLGVISSMMAVVGESAGAVQTTQPAIVSADPAAFTPHVLDGKVEAIAQFGNTVYLGGIFSQARDANRQLVQSRTNILAFDATTGVISSWAPAVDGEVTSIVVAPDGASLYVGGFFNNIGGQSRRSVARISTTTGLNVAGFSTPNLSGGRVRDMRLSAGKLWIAGQFPSVSGNAQARLATLDATTGRYDPFMSLAVAGIHDPTTNNGGGTTDVVKIDITPDGSRLLGVGNFKTVGGQDRDQIFQLDLTGASATLANWQTNTFKALCVAVFNTYIRDIDYSPDGAFFVVSTTGASRGAASPCDSISRFETGSPGTGLLPTWLTHTGGDTTYAVAVAGDVTYAGGHMRWVNNPFNADSAGQGSISRQGIVALESISGLPYSWNPTRERGVGVFDLLATSQGLWMGSDTDWTGTPQELHPRIAFFPLAGGTAVSKPNAGQLPGRVLLAGKPGINTASVLHRMNAGGPALAALDDGMAWAVDTASSSARRNTGSSSVTFPTLASVDPSVPATTPTGVFLSERWDPSGSPEMEWNFPVTAGVPIQVRLYFAGQATTADQAGERVFDVRLDTATVLDNYDIAAEVGASRGVMKSFNITSDGNVDIDFFHGVNNPSINAIEIVRTDIPLSTSGDLLSRDYNGTTVGPTSTVPTAGGWSLSTRGAVMIDGFLYSGQPDGAFVKRSFDGTTLGPVVPVNLSDQIVPHANWHTEVPNLTGLFYDRGRLYYTLATQASLYYRTFNPESGAMGAQRYTASASVTGLSFSAVAGMFVSGNVLYWATSDGNLSRINFVNGLPVSGTAQLASGPAVDGHNWYARDMFIYAGPSGPAPNQSPQVAMNVTCTGTTCSGTSSGTFDPDGSIASYAWAFGDGGTASGPSASHTYTGTGIFTVTVTLTVTDDDGAVTVATRTVTVTAPNQMPTASFSLSCLELSCSVDGTASADPDGTLVSHAWAFGDGGIASGTTASHTYATGGSQTITLTVTDDRAGTAEDTRTVNVAAPASAISFVGSASSNANLTTHSVTVPAAVATGDGLLLMMTTSAVTTVPDPTGVTGWQPVDSLNTPSSTTRVWRKVATTNDAGAMVRVTLPSTMKANLVVLAYRGTSTTDPVAGFARAAQVGSTITHSTPTAPVPASAAGSWAVSYWSHRDSATNTLTPPGGVSVRSNSSQTGSGRVTVLAADSGTAVTGSTYGNLTATAAATSQSATMWTIILAPAALGQNGLPTASFTESCTDLTCTVDGTASSDPDGPLTYAWAYGDGATATGVTASRSYETGGSKTITLTVTDDRGATAQSTHTVELVAPIPVIGFVASAASNLNVTTHTVTVPAAVVAGDGLLLMMTTASATTIPNPTIVTGWQALDSISTANSTSRVWRKVAAAGDATRVLRIALPSTMKANLVLLAYRGTSTTDPVANFARAAETTVTSTHTTPSAPVGTPGSWVVSYWSHRDSATNTLTAPGGVTERSNSSGTGSSRVTGLAVDSGAIVEAPTYGDLTATAAATSQHATMWTIVLASTGVQPNQLPVPSFTVACIELSCSADGAASTDAEGPIGSYAWAFGDGATAAGVTASHAYITPGSKTTTLTVTDNRGATVQTTRTFEVVGPPNQLPTASFTVSCIELSCSVDGSASSDPEGPIASYAWAFGAGGTGIGATATHAYLTGGTKTITLTVTDGEGATAQTTRTVEVDGAANQPPTADFTVSCVDLSCAVDGSTSSDPEAPVASYAWAFGDGGTATGVTASHAYTTAGAKTITLTVTDLEGATAETTRDATTQLPNQLPAASFTLSCVELSCSVDAVGSSDPEGALASYAWTFGDGGTASEVTASHTYPTSGNKTITLTVTDDRGGTAQSIRLVDVSPIAFVAAASSNATMTVHSLVVPSTVVAGDGLLLMMSTGAVTTIPDPTNVTGWQVLDSVSTAASTAQMWRKVAVAGDANRTLRVTLPSTMKANLVLLAYRGTSTTDPVAAFAGVAETDVTAAHDTPVVPVATSASWAVSYWSHRDSTTNALIPPSGVAVRSSGTQSGGARVTGLAADSGGPVPGPSYGDLAATAAATTQNATMWTVLLAPAV